MDEVEKLHERDAKLRELKALMLELEWFFNSRGMLYWLDQETGELMYQDVNEPPAKLHPTDRVKFRRLEAVWRKRKDYPWPGTYF